MAAGGLGSEAEYQTKVRFQSFMAQEKVSSVSTLRQVGGQAQQRDSSTHRSVGEDQRGKEAQADEGGSGLGCGVALPKVETGV